MSAQGQKRGRRLRRSSSPSQIARPHMIFGEDTQSGQSAVERRALRYHLVGLHVIVMSTFVPAVLQWRPFGSIACLDTSQNFSWVRAAKCERLIGIMENRKTHQVNEFKVVDDHGKEYTVFEYQEGTEKLSLKWIKAGPSWFRLSDGTAVDRINDNTFKITMIDRVLHRQP